MKLSTLAIFSVGAALVGAGTVYAQQFPTKPVRIITAPSGGDSDSVSRMIAQGITAPLGQPVVVDNRGSGAIAAEVVAKAPADGYSLLVNGGTFWIVTLMRTMSYDPVKDFSPITITGRAPSVLVVNPGVPVNSVKELIALAKAKPGELNFASGGIGGTGHLSGELFNSMAGVRIIHVPYKGSAPSMTDLLSGRVQLTFNDASVVMPLVKEGKLRALAVTSAQPSPLLPGLPPIAATVPGFDAVSMTGVFAPAGTPTVIINQLNQEMVRFLKTPEARQQFLTYGMETVASSPEELTAWIKTDLARWGKVVKEAGIRLD